MYDAYVAFEVVPFIYDHCRSQGIAITTSGASFGAYHAANTILKHPDLFKRCLALSGVYDIRRFMDGDYDDNFYFNNPVDYVASLSDGYYLHHLSQCDIRLATGSGPYEDSAPDVSARRGAGAARHPALGRRLGPRRRPRLAVLEAPDGPVPRKAVLVSRVRHDLRHLTSGAGLR